MPKKVWKVEEFDGGINQKSDARDLEKNELVEAFNVDVSNKGMIKMPGNGKILYDTENINGYNVSPTNSESSIFSESGFDVGWGLFQFSHDFGLTNQLSVTGDYHLRGMSGHSEFICINDGAYINIWCDNGVWNISGIPTYPHSDWIFKAITLGNVHLRDYADITKNVRPVYYKAGNSLRVCDSNFLIEDTGGDFDSISGNVITVSGLDISSQFPMDYSGVGLGGNLPITNYIQINDEIMAVIARTSSTITVFREQFGTKKQTHSSGDDIYRINVPKKLIGISSSTTTDPRTRDSRLKNARKYSDSTNTVFTMHTSSLTYRGWRECIQSLEPPHNYIMPGLRVYDGKVTAMAYGGVYHDGSGADATDYDQLLNEPNPESGNNEANQSIASDSNPEKVLFSLHEAKFNDTVIIGTGSAYGGPLGGQNTIYLHAVSTLSGTSFAAKGFTEGKFVIITGSNSTDGVKEILSVIDSDTIQVAGEWEENEDGGYEMRLEQDTISEDLQSKYVFGMSFLYEGGIGEMQESPIKMGHVHSGLINHDASICRSEAGWEQSTDAASSDAWADLTTSAGSFWYLNEGQLFADDTAISSDFLAYRGTAISAGNYKISIDVEVVGSGTLKIYPPGYDANGGASSGGTVGNGGSDGHEVIINETGTYLFYAKADDTNGPDLTNIFICQFINGGGSDDIKINNVQVFSATPQEMTASNAIGMQEWRGIPQLFSSFNMSGPAVASTKSYSWNSEILGYKIYMKQVDSLSHALTDEWLLALKVDLREGNFINYANNSESTPLHLGKDWSGSGTFRQTLVCTNAVGGNDTGLSYYDSMKDIPLHTYESENGYKSDITTCAMYKTVVQIGRKIYIGNLLIDGKRYPDRMLESPIDRPDTFPNDGLHYIDVAMADGDDIIHLDALGNKLIQFKKKTTYVLEISDEGIEPVETWANAGIVSPSQVVKAGKGLVWVNNYGLFYYDGDKLEIATAESFDLESWIVNENQQNATILGYDEYSKKVIIMTSNISTHDNGGYIYDLTTNSLTEHQNLFDWYSVDAGFQ